MMLVDSASITPGAEFPTKASSSVALRRDFEVAVETVDDLHAAAAGKLDKVGPRQLRHKQRQPGFGLDEPAVVVELSDPHPDGLARDGALRLDECVRRCVIQVAEEWLELASDIDALARQSSPVAAGVDFVVLDECSLATFSER